MPRPRVADRRGRLLDAAEALVLERGFDAMSVAAVAERAGIGKGAVYLEFDSKRAILDELLRRGTERLQARVDAEVGAAPRVSQAYRAAMRALFDDPLMTAAFLDDRSVLGAHVATVEDGRYRTRHRGVVEWLRQLQVRRLLVDDVDPEHLALALSSATIGLLSAGTLVGPVSASTLEGAITVLERMVEVWEPAPGRAGSRSGSRTPCPVSDA